MSVVISQSALTLLLDLQKHSGASGIRTPLDPAPILRRLRIRAPQFNADARELVALGFAGSRDFRPNANDVPSARCSSIWLTKKGDEYLRETHPARVTQPQADDE